MGATWSGHIIALLGISLHKLLIKNILKKSRKNFILHENQLAVFDDGQHVTRVCFLQDSLPDRLCGSPTIKGCILHCNNTFL